MAEIHEELILALRARRQRISMSQQELAARMGRSPASICQIETGLRDTGFRTLVSMASALGCDLEFVLRPTRSGPRRRGDA